MQELRRIILGAHCLILPGLVKVLVSFLQESGMSHAGLHL